MCGSKCKKNWGGLFVFFLVSFRENSGRVGVGHFFDSFKEGEGRKSLPRKCPPERRQRNMMMVFCPLSPPGPSFLRLCGFVFSTKGPVFLMFSSIRTCFECECTYCCFL